MNAIDTTTRDREEPLLAAWPGPDFRALDLRQSVIGWMIGLIVGTVMAALVIAVITGLI
jgi:hypothetical protein